MTYENICLLRSQSGNARVDYRGNCESVPSDASVEEACSNIREKARCQFTRQNCRRLVRPEEGCCPICGKQLNTIHTGSMLFSMIMIITECAQQSSLSHVVVK